MKKLNRKGFTLIELLAVVVILAVILVVTIPSVLSTMEKSKEKSFNDAVEIIRDYVQKQYEISKLDSTLNKDITNFTPASGKTSVPLTVAQIQKAGYSNADIKAFEFKIDNDKVVVVCATAGGNFIQKATDTTTAAFTACTTPAS